MRHHPVSLSPDPLYAVSDRGGYHRLYPWRLIRCSAPRREWADWSDRLTGRSDAGALRLSPDRSGEIDVLLDFGTELEAELELTVREMSGPLYVSFGESRPEAETWGVPTTNPHQTVEWMPGGAGTARRIFPARGFRFVRIRAHDRRAPGRLVRICARAWFAFDARRGDWRCDDERYQRAWQTSVYTARLCTRSDTYWDGIKRDRVGWFGDARVIQETTDAVFADPRPALGMLATLPMDRWVTGIPGYSLDALAMFRQLLLFHGVAGAGRRAIWVRIQAFLDWVVRTQLNREGFIIRDPKAHFFGDIAFVDWSRMPIGGRFEELSWLQCQLLSAWRQAAEIAGWMNDGSAAIRYARRAEVLAGAIRRRFWRPGVGLVHTLNRTIPRWRHLRVLDSLGGADYRRDWWQRPGCGPSGPSRHSMAWAVQAGLIAAPAERALALEVFQSTRIPRLVTAYFLYYEQCARAECGEPAAAIRTLRDFVGRQIEENDSATVWEWYQPDLQDLRKFGLGDWPKSLCHGWSSGLVPMTLRYVVGLRPDRPGFRHLRMGPRGGGPDAFRLEHPTPWGPLIAERQGRREPVVVRCPRRVTVEGLPDTGLRVERGVR